MRSITTPYDRDEYFSDHYLENRHLDVALVAVEETNTAGDRVAAQGFVPLIAESGKAVVGDRVNIIQHPAGEPMQIAIHENRIVDSNDNFLIYETDTKKGSSGSPVFNDQWQLAALHHAGVPATDDQGRMLLKNGNPWEDEPASEIDWIANEGARVSQIVSYLQQLSGLSEAQRALLDRLGKPTRALESGMEMRTAAGRPSSGLATPRLEDGTVCWTLPLELRMRLGSPMIEGPQTAAPMSALQAPSPVTLRDTSQDPRTNATEVSDMDMVE